METAHPRDTSAAIGPFFRQFLCFSDSNWLHPPLNSRVAHSNKTTHCFNTVAAHVCVRLVFTPVFVRPSQPVRRSTERQKVCGETNTAQTSTTQHQTGATHQHQPKKKKKKNNNNNNNSEMIDRRITLSTPPPTHTHSHNAHNLFQASHTETRRGTKPRKRTDFRNLSLTHPLTFALTPSPSLNLHAPTHSLTFTHTHSLARTEPGCDFRFIWAINGR